MEPEVKKELENAADLLYSLIEATIAAGMYKENAVQAINKIVAAHALLKAAALNP